MNEEQKKKTKKCPFCAEEILADAILCKHCKTNLSDPQTVSAIPAGKSINSKVDLVNCDLCGGAFSKKTVGSHTAVGCVFLFLGLICLLAFWPLGLILLAVGLIFGVQSKSYLICKKCGKKIERQRKWLELS